MGKPENIPLDVLVLQVNKKYLKKDIRRVFSVPLIVKNCSVTVKRLWVITFCVSRIYSKLDMLFNYTMYIIPNFIFCCFLSWVNNVMCTVVISHAHMHKHIIFSFWLFFLLFNKLRHVCLLSMAIISWWFLKVGMNT